MMNSMIRDVRNPLTGLLANENNPTLLAPNKEVQNKVIPNVWSKKKHKNIFVRFNKEIEEIKKYGFLDINEIAYALDECDGDVDSAMQRL